MRTKPWCYFFLYVILFSCQQEEKKSTTTVPDIEVPPLQLMDKGVDSIFLDRTANFERLGVIKIEKINEREYLSHYYHLTRFIYIYDLASGDLINKVKLQREGPNQINTSLLIDYFIHTLDSIFVDANSNAYYLLNDKGEVIQHIGKADYKAHDGLSVSLKQASYFDGERIHGSVRMPFNGTPKEKVYARASLKFQAELEIETSVENEDFIDAFDEHMAYRAEEEKSYPRLNNLPRHFAHNGTLLYATTPISDSISIFQNGKLVDSFYAGMPEFELSSFQEYVNFSKSTHKPGEVRYENETRRKGYFTGFAIDPSGNFLYRLLVHGTEPLFYPDLNTEMPEPTGVSLMAIDLKTREIITKELPHKSIWTNQILVGSEGAYFRLKEQDNEDQVSFQIFGFQ